MSNTSPLSEPAAREPVHKRQVITDGFHRDDGLFDIEARLLDTRAVVDNLPFGAPNGRLVQAGDAIHDMRIRLTIDASLVVRAVEVQMPSVPFETCPSVMPAHQGLVGAQIGKGWRRVVNENVGGVLGCTHLRELLMAMATVAFQTVGAWKRKGKSAEDALKETSVPFFMNTCKSWAVDGPVVARLYPQFAIHPVSDDDGSAQQ